MEFHYENSGVRVFKSFGIGLGKLIPWATLISSNRFNVAKFKAEQFSPAPPRVIPWQPLGGQAEPQAVPQGAVNETIPLVPLHTCPYDGCIDSFVYPKNLSRHIAVGQHHYREERETLLDFAKREYAKQQDLSIFKNVPIMSDDF